ncbi:MAG: ribosome recycling factor [Candidatus Atribacteria bacterium]|nr:ribosome recycling factor [Candidatus Atribacteria bacterium]
MVPEILKETEHKMKKVIQITKDELAHLRTGRASTALVENIKVEYYGVATALKEIANIAIPESDLIVIQPWDKHCVSDVEKAIWKSDLGLTPNSDGTVIRLSIPPLTEERRKDIVKLVRKEIESSKVAVRNIRREMNDKIKKMEKSSDISEDQSKDYTKQVQQLTDLYIKEIDEISKIKEAEIMKV